MSALPLHVEVRNPAAGAALLSLRGRLVGPLAGRSLLDGADGLGPGLDRVVIDLNDLEFMDCAGVGTLAQIACASRSANRRLVFTGMNGRVRQILETAGILGSFEHADSTEAALSLPPQGAGDTAHIAMNRPAR